MKLIPLTKGFHAKVDDEHFESLNQYHWCYDHGYAVRVERRDGRKHKISMHRQITGAPKGTLVDHWNLDTLDNQLHNLRIATKAQNMCNMARTAANKTGYKGVWWDKQRQRYRATITLNRKRIHLGRFVDPRDAAIAYNQAALQYHGKFARLNEV